MSIESPSWPPPSPPPPTGPPPAPEPSSFTFGSEVFLRTAGLGLLVLAVLFVVSTAFTRGWIGPEIQLLGAVGVGAGLLWIGDWLRPRERAWGIALSAGGVLALLATAASNLFGELVGVDAAYGAIAAVSALGFAVAWRSDGSAVASSTMLGGAVAWAVVDGPVPVLAMASWTLLAAAGGVVMAELRRWASLRPLAVVTAGLILLPLADAADRLDERLLVGVGAAVLGVVGLLGPRRTLGGHGWLVAERQMVTVVGPWLLGVGHLLTDPTERGFGLAALAVAGVLAAAAFAADGLLDLDHRNSILISAALCGVIALDQLLDGPALLLGVALEAAGLLWSRRTLGGDDPRLLVGGILLGVPAAVVLAARTVRAWEVDAPVVDDVLHLVVAVVLVAAGWLLARELSRALSPAAPLYAMVWLGSVLVHLPQGQMLVSLSWAVIGLGLLVAGAVLKDRAVLGGGVAVIATTVAKLLTVDLAEVDTLWRAALFFVIGVGMLRTGYALPALVGRFAQSEKVSGDDTATEATTSAEEWPTRIS